MFSVIVPVFNNANILSRCIDSILEQTFKEFEIIVVNDGSTDNIDTILDKYDDNRLKVIHQDNSGVSVARNNGIKTSIFEYICFLDADDAYLPCHLETFKKMIDIYPSELMYVTCYKTIMLDGTISDSSTYLESIKENTFKINDLFDIMMKTNSGVFNTNSVCLHASVFTKIGYFVEGEKVGEDTDLWYRIAAFSDVVLSKSVTTIRYRDFSIATRNGVFHFDWVFEKRLNSLLEDERIIPSKKKNIELFIDRYKISKSRHYLLTGNKYAARNELASIHYTKGLKFKIALTKVCFIVPSILLKTYIHKKHKSYYQK